MKRIHKSLPHRLVATFAVPLVALTSIIGGLVAQYGFGSPAIAQVIYGTGVAIGSLKLIRETVRSILKGNLALDYIAILAISVGVISGHYLVAAVIVLMLSGGEALEDYSLQKAQSSLTNLANRIPHTVHLWENNAFGQIVSIEHVNIGQEICIRKGEVIPLDGILVSTATVIDESSLTGEALPVDKKSGDLIRSGTVNMSSSIVVRVTKAEKDSTYRKIVTMVQEAQSEKAPLIRLADKYSGVFTLISLALAVIAYFASGGELSRVLAVLVIATPCPLILATPIALMGGMSAAASKRIIFKRLASIEVLSRVDALMFDKTGTITVGKPVVSRVDMLDHAIDPSHAHAITYILEKNSLHPLAKALVTYLHALPRGVVQVTDITEEIGKGISGRVGEDVYRLGKPATQEGMMVALRRNDTDIVHYHLTDVIKPDSTKVFSSLLKQGIELSIFTGDTQAHADDMVKALGIPVTVKAHCTPEDKKNGIHSAKQKGHIIAMVGDGINDAPALAYADVGMVFSNEENTAATEAADVVFLGGNTHQITDALSISKRTIKIATQSIFVGIGVSTIGMLFAAAGFVPPIVGAFIQEAIDVAVILNALRASRSS
ncbi:MAG: heavy metal translocating P-type ATPase [Candidatus Roizmanbacteria bacterium]